MTILDIEEFTDLFSEQETQCATIYRDKIAGDRPCEEPAVDVPMSKCDDCNKIIRVPRCKECIEDLIQGNVICRLCWKSYVYLLVL